MKIQPPVAQSEKKSNPWIAIVLILVIAAAAAGTYVYLNSYFKDKAAVPPLEILTFAGKVEVSSNGSQWDRPKVGAAIKPVQYIRTNGDGEIDLKFGKAAFMRLKEKTQAVYMAPSKKSSALGRIHILKGSFLMANTGGENLEVSFNEHRADAPSNFLTDRDSHIITSEGISYYMVSVDPDKKHAALHSLRGKVTMNSSGKTPLSILQTESLIKDAEGNFKKSKISQDNWKDTREAYEVPPVSTSDQAIQMDMAKKAGNFFRFVIDHGTFYQQKFGWCEREFVTPEDGSPVYFETTYDVFPVSSWVGVYMKTRDFDISKFKTFQVEARRIPGRPHPDNIRIEFKAKYQVVQAFAVKMLKPEWEKIEFPLRISKETPINEMTIIFSNDKVGSEKSGGVQFRNFNLVDADKVPVAAKDPELAPESLRVATKVAQNVSAITNPKEAPAERTSVPAAAKEEETDDLLGLEEL